MRAAKIVLALVVVLVGVLATEPAFAWGRARVGIYVGVPLVGFGYPYYYPPYSYYPPYYPQSVVVQQPAVYVEQPAQQPAPAAAQPQGYWYYCSASRAYYPYVKECASGWQPVAPQPG